MGEKGDKRESVLKINKKGEGVRKKGRGGGGEGEREKCYYSCICRLFYAEFGFNSISLTFSPRTYSCARASPRSRAGEAPAH